MSTLIELFRETHGVFIETNKLIQIILTYPVTSNEGERSFSMLRRLYTWLRASMKADRLDDLGRMHGHPIRLANITNDRIIDIFVGRGPRRLQFTNPYRSKPTGGNNISYIFFYCFIDIIIFLLGFRFLTIKRNFLKNCLQQNSNLFFYFILTKKTSTAKFLWAAQKLDNFNLRTDRRRVCVKLAV